MNKNIYDSDCQTWSPQGRVFQIEYAGEAVKQGSCIVGVRSKHAAVLCALRRSVSKLADYNAKILKVDDHIAVTFSGITADALLIVKRLRMDCLDHQFAYGTKASIERLLYRVALDSQENTQDSGSRPFGVGLLVAGYDKTGAHIFETTPAGDYIEYVATALGARCQAAKTFLEQEADVFAEASNDQLIDFAIRALASTASAEQSIDGETIHLAIVGKDQEYKELTAEELNSRLQALNINTEGNVGERME